MSITQITLLGLGFYLVIIILISRWGKHKLDAEEFSIASRDLGPWQIGLSMTATFISTYNILQLVLISALFGFWTGLLFIGLFLGVGIMIIIRQRYDTVFRKEKFLNMADIFQTLFGSHTWRLTSLFMLLILIAYATLQIRVNSEMLASLFDFELLISTFLTCGFVLAYLLLGGFRAVVNTDIFQSIFLFILIGILLYIIPGHFDWDRSISESASWAVFYPAAIFLVLQTSMSLVQPDTWQRVYGARDLRTLIWGAIIFAISVLLIQGPIVFIGLAFAHGFAGETDFFTAVFSVIPPWLIPVLGVAMTAAFMSTLDSSLFASALQALRLFQLKSSPNLIRLLVILAVLIALPLALFSGTLLDKMMSLASVASCLGVVILAGLTGRFTDWQGFWICLAAGGTAIFLRFAGYLTMTNPVSMIYPILIMFLGFVLVWLWQLIGLLKIQNQRP